MRWTVGLSSLGSTFERRVIRGAKARRAAQFWTECLLDRSLIRATLVHMLHAPYRSAVACALLLACNSESPNPVSGNGGANSSTGGSSAPATITGGTTSVTNGGSSSASGGEVIIGGSTAFGGSSMTTGGSAPSSGGTVATGGTKPATGGSMPTNGGASVATGGTKPTTGGSSATIGGTAAGGTSNGGNGGASTGGKAATGGTVAVVAIGGSHSGQATFYDPNGNGNCSYGTAVNGKDIAALNKADYGLATWCGACAEITGPKGKLTVLIQDSCPSCSAGDLDLNPAAFDKIANHADGRVAITWKFVSCDVTGPVAYHFKEGSSPGWTAVQVLNHRLPIAKFEYSTDNGNTWKVVERVDYNYFIVASGFGPFAAQVRITAPNGQTLTDTLPIPTSDTTVQGQTNF